MDPGNLFFAFSDCWWFEPWNYYNGTSNFGIPALWHPSALCGDNSFISERKVKKTASCILGFTLDRIGLLLAISDVIWSIVFLIFSSLLTRYPLAFLSQCSSLFPCLIQKYFLKCFFPCQLQVISHCLLQILLVSKVVNNMPLQHTTPKDLVGFNILLAAGFCGFYLQNYELLKQECKLFYCCLWQ